MTATLSIAIFMAGVTVGVLAMAFMAGAYRGD